MDVTVIGYGSLMSGRGLSSSGAFQVKRAFVVALTGCRRGFAKLSRYGDRFAMDLEIVGMPLKGMVMAPTTSPNGEVEALALTVPLDDACRLAKREGYDPTVVRHLAVLAQERRLSLAEFLWELHSQADHDAVLYRRRLFTLTGFTSAHYVPHPVYVRDIGYALVFLAPGFEGTGADDITSVRQQTGIRTIMRTVETWRKKRTPDQLSYFLVCLLGGTHGICVRDLVPSAADDTELYEELGLQLMGELQQEVRSFLSATGLSPEQYRRVFGEPEAALLRSGLGDLLVTSQKKTGRGRSLFC